MTTRTDPFDPVALREAKDRLKRSFHQQLSRDGFRGETLGMMLAQPGMPKGLRKLVNAFNREAQRTQLHPSELSAAAHHLAMHLQLRDDEQVVADLVVLKARTAAERNLREQAKREAREQPAQPELADDEDVLAEIAVYAAVERGGGAQHEG